MSTTHTPGPWTVWQDDGLQIRDERYILLATVRPSRKHAEANARLIAAAPDLLAALEDLVKFKDGSDVENLTDVPASHRSCECYACRLEKAKKAISDAKGEAGR